MAAEAPVPTEPPRSPEATYGPFLWVAAGVAALLLILALMRRRTGPPEPVGPSHPPEEPDAEPLPSAFSPPAPAVVDEPPPPPEPEEEGPVLPRIPRASTEWQEGDDLEGVDEPDAELRSVEELVAALRTGEPSVCDAAVRDLAKHGRAAVPALEQALSDPDPDLRVDAARALAAIRGDAR